MLIIESFIIHFIVRQISWSSVRPVPSGPSGWVPHFFVAFFETSKSSKKRRCLLTVSRGHKIKWLMFDLSYILERHVFSCGFLGKKTQRTNTSWAQITSHRVGVLMALSEGDSHIALLDFDEKELKRLSSSWNPDLILQQFLRKVG